MLSPRWLGNNACVYAGSSSVDGACPALVKTTANVMGVQVLVTNLAAVHIIGNEHFVRCWQTFRWTISFASLFWDNALTADTMQLRGYRCATQQRRDARARSSLLLLSNGVAACEQHSALAWYFPQSLSFRRTPSMVGGCDGAANVGLFGSCCDDTSECSDGLVCDS